MISDRIKTIQQNLDINEALIIVSDSNRYYLTEFKSSAGALFITKTKSVLLIDSRYYNRAISAVTSAEVALSVNLIAELNELIKVNATEKLFVEATQITLSRFNFLSNSLNTQLANDDKFDLLINDMRSVKDKAEISNIIEAQKITDETFDYILSRIAIGRTEREIMLDMEYHIRKLGSEGIAFDFIVVSGENSSNPHGVPTDRRIASGDFITIDFGAVINGYRSDMTRTVAMRSVTDEQRFVYNTVLEAQKLAINSIIPKAICKDVDSLARNYIAEKGYKDCFGHGLGHSVGIDIHESPAFNTRDNTALKPGMVLTVEPGIYIPNKFGVRIEDMIVVTDNGCNNITKSPKELIIL